MKLILHTCCAPCSVYCVEALGSEGIRPDLFWYNPNIHPAAEYKARRDTLVQFAGDKGLDLLMEDKYGLRSFLSGLGQGYDRRCAYCYRIRLKMTAALAAERGYDFFSTTLLISPYQKHDLIRETAEEAAKRHGVRFLYRDFRPGFQKGQRQAREGGLYMQKYCGCIFSEEERYLEKKNGKE